MDELLSLDNMRDTKSVLLALLSIGLVCTWIYHLYDKTIYSRQIAETPVKQTTSLTGNLRDSLKKDFVLISHDPGTGSDPGNNKTDSLNKNEELIIKFDQVNRLKNEISTPLNNTTANSADLDLAREKMARLQQKTEELRNDKAVLEEQKKKMTGILEQMTGEIDETEKDVKKLDKENKVLTQKITVASTFSATKLKMSAISTNGSSEKETSEAKKTGKFNLSFVVQNNAVQYNNAELYIVVIKPDGQVLQSQEVWESGSFDTNKGDKKNYTLKMRFEYNKGEPKQLVLSLNAENYPKGNYRMQVYHNGTLIGQAVKKLV